MNTDDAFTDEFPDARSYGRPQGLSDALVRQQRMNKAQSLLDAQEPRETHDQKQRVNTEEQKRQETEKAFKQYAAQQDFQNHLAAYMLGTCGLAAFLFVGHYLFPAAWAWLLHFAHFT